MKRILYTVLTVLLFVSVALAADQWITWNNSTQRIKIQSASDGASALAESVKSAKPWKLHGFRVHVSSAPTTSENLTVTRDAADGAVYDTTLYSRDLSADSVTDLVYKFDPPEIFNGGDEADFAYANTDSNTIGLEVIWEEKQ